MRHTLFYRISNCINACGNATSVCMHEAKLSRLLHFAYQDRSTVNRAVRSASRDLALISTRTVQGSAPNVRSWSQAVVSRALAKLTGAYDPVKAAALESILTTALESAALDAVALAPLAADNNAAWEQVAA